MSHTCHSKVFSSVTRLLINGAGENHFYGAPPPGTYHWQFNTWTPSSNLGCTNGRISGQVYHKVLLLQLRLCATYLNHGCNGRVDRRTVVVETHMRIAHSCRQLTALYLHLYRGYTNPNNQDNNPPNFFIASRAALLCMLSG